MARSRDVFMGVVSYHASSCYEHELNPDLEELLRYNQAAKQRECKHLRQRTISGDYYSYRQCVDCTEIHDLPKPERLDGKPYDPNRSATW